MTDLLDESDEEPADPAQHRRLLQSMQSLDPRGPPRKKFKALQSEIRAESEYNLGPSAMRVELADLMPSLDDSQEYGDLKRKLEKLSDSKEPVAQPLSERLKDQ